MKERESENELEGGRERVGTRKIDTTTCLLARLVSLFSILYDSRFFRTKTVTGQSSVLGSTVVVTSDSRFPVRGLKGLDNVGVVGGLE